MSASNLPDWDRLRRQLYKTEYTAWQRRWVWLPVKTIGGHKIWFSWVYWRSVYLLRLDVRTHVRVEYADDFDLLKTAE
jgi:hypothetical protein